MEIGGERSFDLGSASPLEPDRGSVPSPLVADGNLVEIHGADLRLLHAYWWKMGSRWELIPRRLPNSMLYIPIDCPLLVRVGEDQTVLEPGRVALLPADVTHSAKFPAQPVPAFHLLCFHFHIHDRYGRDLIARYPQRFQDVPDWPDCLPRLRRLAEAVFGGTEDGIAWATAGIRMLLMDLLMAAGRLIPIAAPDPRIAKCLESIRNDPKGRLSVEELARLARLKPRHFRDLFAKATGVHPKEFLIRQRIHEAVRLLGDQRSSIKDIARHLEFSSDHEFHSCFKKVTGRTPSQWRSANPNEVAARSTRSS